jgi:hypothetical protein
MAVPEGKTREYKQDLSSPAKAMRALVALANSPAGSWWWGSGMTSTWSAWLIR